jgi:hypothetical protein
MSKGALERLASVVANLLDFDYTFISSSSACHTLTALVIGLTRHGSEVLGG